MRRIGVCVMALALAAACGKSSTSPSGGNVHSCGGGTITGTMTATVDGTSFVATCLDTASFVSGIVGLGGTNVSQSNPTNFIDIAMAVQATAAGTFSVSAGSANNASLSIGGSKFWEAGAASAGTGSVVITAVSATEVSGTFSFNMVAGPGGTGTKTVTNGKFDIIF